MRALEDEKKTNSKMDKEGLVNELLHYKRFSLEQFETIRLLKVEIAKIKKFAAQRDKTLGGEKDLGSTQGTKITTAHKKFPLDAINNNDFSGNEPKDMIDLKREIIALKELLREQEEDRKVLRAARDKYEKRFKYTLDKFNQIKEKEMMLIQMGEEKVKGEIKLVEQKYKKKVESLSDQIKQLMDENGKLKMKIIDKNKQRDYRLELEKSQKQVSRLQTKVKRLEALNSETAQQMQLQAHLATGMVNEGVERIERDEQERLEREAKEEEERRRKELEELEEPNSQQDQEIEKD